MSRSRALQSYVVARLLLAPLMLWTVNTVVFLLLRATPGDPVDAILGPKAPAAQKMAMRAELGLDQPLWHQYTHYLGDLLQLNLGESLSRRGLLVWDIIQEFLPATVELACFSMIVALVVGISAGLISGSRPGTVLESGGRLFGTITYALPMFWVGMMLQLIFAVQFSWFPVNSRFPLGIVRPDGPTGLLTIDSLFAGNIESLEVALHHLALPSLTLGVVLSGIFERIVRVNLRQTLQADYIEAARARGIPERRILVTHALRNALIPVITIMGLTFAPLLGGAVLTEVTFSWPGLGGRLYQAIGERDYTTVQGIVSFVAIVIVMASILIDIINAYVDPRIRY